jgi:hypothetical protein
VEVHRYLLGSLQLVVVGVDRRQVTVLAVVGQVVVD